MGTPHGKQGWRGAQDMRRASQRGLVDEFAGTGKTMTSRVHWVRSAINVACQINAPSSPVSIRVCLLAGMEDAIRAIREIGVDVFSAITLRKGISQHFLDDDLYSARERMRAIEGRLSPQIDDEPLPTFGYGQAEALFRLTAIRRTACFRYSGGPIPWMENVAERS